MTDIRPEVSRKNKYWISNHKYYELKHFCLQFPEWVNSYNALNDYTVSSIDLSEKMSKTNNITDPTADIAIAKEEMLRKINLIKEVAKNADESLCDYILIAVTKGYSYKYLKTVMNIPCSKDMYYDRYRKFFYLLSKER